MQVKNVQQQGTRSVPWGHVWHGCDYTCVCVCVCVCVFGQGEETLKNMLRTFSAMGSFIDKFATMEQMKSAVEAAAVSIA